MQRPVLTSAALRGLLDATPAAIGCFDATGRALYANTAFTMVTGVQAGGVIEDAPLAAELLAVGAGKGAPRRVRLGGRGRMPVSGTLFMLEEGLIGMVLDAGAHEALAALAEEQSALRRGGAPRGGGAGAPGARSALRRAAPRGATGPEPEAVSQAVAEEAGRLLHARWAATIRYEGDFALT